MEVKQMYNFKQKAVESIILSDLMQEREKISTEEVIKKYPEGITVTDFDFVTIENKTFVVLTFEEDKTKFLNGGFVLTKVFSEIVEDFEGEVEAAREEYSKCENKIVAVLSAGKTKDGKNNITKVQIR